MKAVGADPKRIRAAWQGRISGCILGKPLEVLSFQQGLGGLTIYLEDVGALPLRDYVPVQEGSIVDRLGSACCLGRISRAEPDDDINYTVVALTLLEGCGVGFDVTDVARAWLRLLPAGATWTAERAAYATLLTNMNDEFVNGEEAGFDIWTHCAALNHLAGDDETLVHVLSIHGRRAKFRVVDEGRGRDIIGEVGEALSPPGPLVEA